MSYRTKLFKYKKPYDLEGSQTLFVKAMKENCLFQYNNCDDYRRILDQAGFNPNSISSFDDLINLPILPTLYFKRHQMFSMSQKRMMIKATSSGTSGSKSQIGFNFLSLLRGLKMVIKIGKYHHLWSLKGAHYIIFGYQPNRHNKTAISKTAYGFTFFAPALSRSYALVYKNGKYEVDLEGLKKTFIKYSKAKHPVRTLGFPYYTYLLLTQMKEEGIFLKLPKGSIISLGGGWKQFYAHKVDKKEFYQLVEEVLGVDEKHVIEFFGAVEHPILFTDCRYHHFHIPVYARVVIRDVDTLKPVENGKVGLINLMTPMVDSVPILNIMTDDLGILHDEPCPCGEKSPYLEIIGRVGIKDIVTCAQGADELLKK